MHISLRICLFENVVVYCKLGVLLLLLLFLGLGRPFSRNRL
jgi:hypothetical protein